MTQCAMRKIYPPYQHMDDVVCYAKDLKPGFGVMVLWVL